MPVPSDRKQQLQWEKSASTLKQLEIARHRNAQLEQTCILLPERHPFLMRWDVCTALLLVIVALLTPFEAGFLDTNPLSALGIFNIVVNLFFAADMLLQFFLAYSIETRYGPRWVMNKWKVAQRYLRTWFLLDLISTVPFDLISPGQGLVLLRTVRLLRLLKLLRLARGIRVVRRWQAEIGLSYRKVTLYMLFASVWAASHWIACALGVLSRFQLDGPGSERIVCTAEQLEAGDTDCSISWLTEAVRGEKVLVGDATIDIPVVDAYIASFYTSITILVHPHAYNATGTGERIVFTVLLVAGGFMWTQIISRSTAIATSLNAHVLSHQQTMDDLNNIAERLALPQDMRVRLRKFFLRSKAQHEYEAWQKIMQRMSPQLRRDTYREVNVHWVKKIRFLDCCSTSFLTDIAEVLKLQMYGEHEHFGKMFHMYIMMGGAASRTTNFKVMVPGHVWGEDHLLLTNAELLLNNIAVALTVTEVQELSKPSFDAVLADYPEHYLDIRHETIKLAVMRGVKRLAKLKVQEEFKANNPQLACAWDRQFSSESRSSHDLEDTDGKEKSPPSKRSRKSQRESVRDSANHIRREYAKIKSESSSHVFVPSKVAHTPVAEKTTPAPPPPAVQPPAAKGIPKRKATQLSMGHGLRHDAGAAAAVAWFSPMDAAAAATAAAVHGEETTVDSTIMAQLDSLCEQQKVIEQNMSARLDTLSRSVLYLIEMQQEQQAMIRQHHEMLTGKESSPRRSQVAFDSQGSDVSPTSPKSPGARSSLGREETPMAAAQAKWVLPTPVKPTARWPSESADFPPDCERL